MVFHPLPEVRQRARRKPSTTGEPHRPCSGPASDAWGGWVTSSSCFGPATRAWFRRRRSPRPPSAQGGAWRSVAPAATRWWWRPTGSGKTPGGVPVGARPAGVRPAAARRSDHRCRVLYVSPLKALTRRRRAQPAGAAGRHRARGRPSRPGAPDITVGMRTGDTPADERGAGFGKSPPDILITTPESLFLLLDLAGARVAARASRRSSSTRCTPSPAPSAAPTWRCRSERLDAHAGEAGPAHRLVGHRAPHRRGGRASSAARRAVQIVAAAQREALGSRGRRAGAQDLDRARRRRATGCRRRSGSTKWRGATASIWPHVEQRGRRPRRCSTGRPSCSPTRGGWPSD